MSHFFAQVLAIYECRPMLPDLMLFACQLPALKNYMSSCLRSPCTPTHSVDLIFIEHFPDWKVNDHTSLFATKYLRWSVLFLRQFYLSCWISFFSGLLFPFSPPHATVLIHYYTNIFSSCEPQYSQCILE